MRFLTGLSRNCTLIIILVYLQDAFINEAITICTVFVTLKCNKASIGVNRCLRNIKRLLPLKGNMRKRFEQSIVIFVQLKIQIMGEMSANIL